MSFASKSNSSESKPMKKFSRAAPSMRSYKAPSVGSYRSGKKSDNKSVNSYMKRNQGVLKNIRFALQGGGGNPHGQAASDGDDMDFDKSQKSFKANMDVDMQSRYTYNESEDVSEYDPNRF